MFHRAQSSNFSTPVLARASLQHKWVKPKTILVPLDGTPEAERALPLAVAIAQRSHAALRLVQVRTPKEYEDHHDLLLIDDGHSLLFRLPSDVYLEGLAERIAAASQIPVKADTIAGADVADALQSVCGGSVALVIMVRSRRSALSRFWYGSPTNSLLSRLSVPLLLVAGTAPPSAKPLFRRILLPFDGPGAANVLEQAVAIANPSNTEIRLLRVLSLGMVATTNPGGRVESSWASTPVGGLRAQAWFQLMKVQKRLKSRGFETTTRVVFGQSKSRAVVAQAAGFQADLIALTQGQYYLPWWLRDGVPEYVVRNTSSNLLIVPSNNDA